MEKHKMNWKGTRKLGLILLPLAFIALASLGVCKKKDEFKKCTHKCKWAAVQLVKKQCEKKTGDERKKCIRIYINLSKNCMKKCETKFPK